MTTNPDLRRAFILFILSILNSRYVYGYPGRVESDGSVTFDVVGRPGYIYVTIWRGGKIAVDKAVNGGANPNPNLLVQMERLNGVLTILRADPASAVQLFQEFASSAFVPPFTASLGSGVNDPVEGRRFVPGLLAPSADGGLNVRVFPFFTKFGYVAGDESFLIDDPSTASTRAWVVVYADSSNVLQYSVSTTHHSGTTGTLSESLIPSEITLPDGATPVGAVVVANGGSVSADSQFADYRFHFDHNDLFGDLGDIAGLTTATPALGDFSPWADISDSNNPKKSTLQSIIELYNSLSATMTNKTLTAPTIADFTNMQHDHLDTDDGGTLSAAAIASGTLVHERGGLEADVSAFAGLLKISGGATSQAVDGTDFLLNLGSLTEEKVLDLLLDSFPFRDNSAGANRRIELIDLLIPYFAQANMAVNGGMEFRQRNNGTVTSPVTATYLADNLKWVKSGAGEVTYTRSTTVPAFAENAPNLEFSTSIDVTTADSSIASTDIYALRTYIEGYDWRVAYQNAVAISFWVRSTVTGTYSLGVRNSGADRFYIAEYTISAGDTWEYKTVVIPMSGLSGGTWNLTTGIGLEVNFVIAAGSNFHGAVGAWTTGDDYASANQVNGMSSTSNFFFVTGFMAVPGQIAVPYYALPFADRLRKCQRLYSKSYPVDTVPGTASVSTYISFLAASVYQVFLNNQYPTVLRVIPTLSTWSFGGTSAKFSDILGVDAGSGTCSFNSNGTTHISGGGDSGLGLTAGTTYIGHYAAEAGF